MSLGEGEGQRRGPQWIEAEGRDPERGLVDESPGGRTGLRQYSSRIRADPIILRAANGGTKKGGRFRSLIYGRCAPCPSRRLRRS
jgi:hypothetical protein